MVFLVLFDLISQLNFDATKLRNNIRFSYSFYSQSLPFEKMQENDIQSNMQFLFF